MVNLFQKVPNLGIIAAIRVTNFDTVSKFGNFFLVAKDKNGERNDAFCLFKENVRIILFRFKCFDFIF